MKKVISFLKRKLGICSYEKCLRLSRLLFPLCQNKGLCEIHLKGLNQVLDEIIQFKADMQEFYNEQKLKEYCAKILFIPPTQPPE